MAAAAAATAALDRRESLGLQSRLVSARKPRPCLDI